MKLSKEYKIALQKKLQANLEMDQSWFINLIIDFAEENNQVDNLEDHIDFENKRNGYEWDNNNNCYTEIN